MGTVQLKIQVDSLAIMKKYARANGIVNAEITMMNERFIKKAKNIAHNQIMQRVYAIPQAPGTVYERTMALERGVRAESKGFVALLYIDRSVVSPKGFFYPTSVEFGLDTNPSYFGRHFWEFTRSLVRSQYFIDGVMARSFMIRGILL